MCSVEGPATVQYAAHFWGEKHHGFQVLYENTKKGEEAAQELAQFVKERLQLEEEYSKMLGKSVHKVASFISSGSSLETAWALTKGTLELLAEMHVMMVKNLQDLSREIIKYKDELSKSRKEAKQQQTIEAVNLMQTTTTCLQKAKETYYARCSEFEKVRKELNTNPKEVAKAESKMLKAKEEYTNYVDKYEAVRSNFLEKMEAACRQFQAHDRSLYAALQQFLILYSTHHQEMTSSALQICGQYRESLMTMNIDDILRKIIETKGTGVERPPPAVFEECDIMLTSEDLIIGISGRHSPSVPSSSSSSAVIHNPPPPQAPTANDLLLLDHFELFDSNGKAAGNNVENLIQNEKTPIQPSPTASASSDSTAGLQNAGNIQQGSTFSSSIGGGTGKKLSLFLPKRKKTLSQSSAAAEDNVSSSPTIHSAHEAAATGGGLFKFKNRKTKKSLNEIPSAVERELSAPAGIWPPGPEDANSTASSSRSEHLNGSNQQQAINPLDTPIAPLGNRRDSTVDEEGYTIRHESREEPTHWGSSCSSDEEDEVEMQQSKIRGLTIRPVDSASRGAMNAASVEELKDAIGHISLARSSTFDKDPWSSSTANKATIFSQTFAAGSLKPLKPNHTADGRFRTNFGESEFSSNTISGGGLNFSASMGPIGMARARPRSNTPTHNSGFGLASQLTTAPAQLTTRMDSVSSIDWGSSFNVHNEGGMLSDSSFNLSASTTNLMQATIREQRVPIAMALNEYSHAWFKSADVTAKENRVIRVFGTVLVSFAASSISFLADIHSDIDKLQFKLINANHVKRVLPNKQLLLPHSPIDKYTFDRLALANWLLNQQKEKPGSSFYNAEVLRYEVDESGRDSEPPLLFTSYWKCDDKTTDVRIDYRLNPNCHVNSALLNISFTTKIDSQIDKVVSEPEAKWESSVGTLSWNLTELSQHGAPGGSLKARLHMVEGSKVTTPSQTHVQFQCMDSNLSGIDIALETSDVYHLSMLKRKVQSGKYICDPEVRK